MRIVREQANGCNEFIANIKLDSNLNIALYICKQGSDATMIRVYLSRS